jgi:hypothetical protein
VVSVRERHLSADNVALNDLLGKVPRFIPLPDINQLTWRIRQRYQMLLLRWCESNRDELFDVLLVHLIGNDPLLNL